MQNAEYLIFLSVITKVFTHDVHFSKSKLVTSRAHRPAPAAAFGWTCRFRLGSTFAASISVHGGLAFLPIVAGLAAAA